MFQDLLLDALPSLVGLRLRGLAQFPHALTLGVQVVDLLILEMGNFQGISWDVMGISKGISWDFVVVSGFFQITVIEVAVNGTS